MPAKTRNGLRKTLGTSKSKVGYLKGFRSGLEESIAADLNNNGRSFEYENWKIPYTKPPKPSTYTPDFTLPNGIIIESKGIFNTADRQKHRLIKEQHPDLDIRFVFNRSQAKINKGSKTSYANWCDKHGFKYADKSIPEDWLEEEINTSSLAAIKAMRQNDKSSI